MRSGGRNALGLPVLAAYAFPVTPATFLFVLTYVYFVKFSTDVLLVAPAAIALIFGLSRIWDAISDPMAGYLSDRTRSAFGRRRTWVLGSALPMALTALMIWSPPSDLEGVALLVWLALALFGFSTAFTAFEVPHNALGAELSERPDVRAGLFGARTWLFVIGSYGALTLGIATIRTAEDPRRAATWLISAVGLLAVVAIAFGVSRLRERSDYAGRGSTSPFRAYRDVLRNPHARRVLFVVFTEYLGSGGAVVMITYVFDYVLGAANFTELNFVAIGLAQLLSIPVWVRLASRIEKKNVWRIAMCLAAFGCLLQFGFGLLGSAWGFVISSFLFGFGASATHVMGSAILADVVDADEFETGERKEGAYFASWHFTRKSVQGLMLVIAGLALEWSGFRPNVAQSEATRFTMLSMATLAPCAGYALAFAFFSGFRLTREVSAGIRAELDRRAEIHSGPREA